MKIPREIKIPLVTNDKIYHYRGLVLGFPYIEINKGNNNVWFDDDDFLLISLDTHFRIVKSPTFFDFRISFLGFSLKYYNQKGY